MSTVEYSILNYNEKLQFVVFVFFPIIRKVLNSVSKGDDGNKIKLKKHSY